jgi:MFS family permease
MVPIMVILPVVGGWLPFPLTVLGGLTSGLSFSVIMVLAQSLLPGGKGLASGFTMGFMFASGAIGNVINGWLADWLGLAISLQSVAAIAAVAAACALFLPPTRPAAIQGAATDPPPNRPAGGPTAAGLAACTADATAPWRAGASRGRRCCPLRLLSIGAMCARMGLSQHYV